jgi:prevent-host-death family protein
MTIGGELRALGVREARRDLRSIVDQVVEGEPVAIHDRTQPVAVLLRHDEADRWERIARGFASLHAHEIYPELVRSTAELAPMVRGEVTVSDAALGRLIRQRQEILAAATYVGLADVRVKFASLLAQAMKGRPVMIVSYSEPRAILISFREYKRLTAVSRAVAWFQNRGLDLAKAQPDEVGAWVTAFREGRPAAAEDAAGAQGW